MKKTLKFMVCTGLYKCQNARKMHHSEAKIPKNPLAPNENPESAPFTSALRRVTILIQIHNQ